LEKLILTLHIIVCVVLVILVLLQSGKEGMGVIFGGGSSSLFGSTGAGGILVKLTAFIAVVFLATSLSYNIMTSSSTTKPSTIINVPLDDPSAPTVPAKPSANGTMPLSRAGDATTPPAATAPSTTTPTTPVVTPSGNGTAK
jgi:preprotein translocase subunit SecG